MLHLWSKLYAQNQFLAHNFKAKTKAASTASEVTAEKQRLTRSMHTHIYIWIFAFKVRLFFDGKASSKLQICHALEKVSFLLCWKLGLRPRFLFCLCVCPRLKSFLFPKSGEALDGRTGVLHDSLKGWRLSCSATGWGSVGWRSCSCNLLQFPRSQFQCHSLEQPLQRLSKFLYTTPPVFSTQGLVLSSKFRVWFENFWKMHKILWLLILHWILVLLKNLLYKSWVKVSYLFFECFWKCKREALKVSNSFSSL